MLYHVSEDPSIARFEPRPAPGVEGGVVWAVGEDRLRNYLLPRDCPRVTFFAGERTTPADADRFLGASAAVVAFEAAWLRRVLDACLYCYRMPEDGFRCTDRCAGYHQTTAAVVPVGVDTVDDCLSALVSRGVEVRVLPSLWALHDAVTASTVSFSIIRMRNAAPRPHG